MRLHGKSAFITGGTSGIGLATAKLFRREGARVAVTGRDESRFEEVRCDLGEDALVLKADVRSSDDMGRTRDRIERAFGGLNVFFANAGVALPTPLCSTDGALYDELMDVNVKGLFFSMQAISPILRDGSAVIINTSFLNRVGRPGRSLISASKAAARSFARTWSSELLDRRIRVNAVSPGGIDTPLHGRGGAAPDEVQANKDRLASRVPVGRLGDPDEIANAVLFLASDESRYVLGAEIVVDGGISQL